MLTPYAQRTRATPCRTTGRACACVPPERASSRSRAGCGFGRCDRKPPHRRRRSRIPQAPAGEKAPVLTPYAQRIRASPSRTTCRACACVPPTRASSRRSDYDARRCMRPQREARASAPLGQSASIGVHPRPNNSSLPYPAANRTSARQPAIPNANALEAESPRVDAIRPGSSPHGQGPRRNGDRPWQPQRRAELWGENPPGLPPPSAVPLEAKNRRVDAIRPGSRPPGQRPLPQRQRTVATPTPRRVVGREPARAAPSECGSAGSKKSPC